MNYQIKSIVLAVAVMAVACSFSACKKRADKVDANFIGFWKNRTESSTIRINSKFLGSEYNHYDGYKNESYTGTARVSESKGIFKIGRKTMQINEYPKIFSTNSQGCSDWTMKLDSEIFYKSDCD